MVCTVIAKTHESSWHKYLFACQVNMMPDENNMKFTFLFSHQAAVGKYLLAGFIVIK